jgi:hypothetical protein
MGRRYERWIEVTVVYLEALSAATEERLGTIALTTGDKSIFFKVI